MAGTVSDQRHDREPRSDPADRHVHVDDVRGARRHAPRRAPRAFRALCQTAGFDVTLSGDIAVPIWEKFILLTAMSGGTAITRLPIGKLRDDPEVFSLFENVMRETEAVGRAEGVRLPADVVEDADRDDQVDAAARGGLDGGRSVARQPAGVAVARRQGCRTGPQARHSDAGERGDFRRAEALREWRAGVRLSVRMIATAERQGSLAVRRRNEIAMRRKAQLIRRGMKSCNAAERLPI